ncbi:metallopeptidase TldD-related protein [Enterobacteriaceae endosymbiont of Plateumaris consimilis]|uniref:metallopeptidase TldD-related protein n=1 Tax=Enterobacteriaceae endosymbiont of Plateumaris consimilis TaxID=2675794 RepID=UPI003CD0C785
MLIIFSNKISFSLFKYLVKLINEYYVYQKLVFLLNSLNKIVFLVWLNIIENPHIL